MKVEVLVAVLCAEEFVWAYLGADFPGEPLQQSIRMRTRGLDTPQRNTSRPISGGQQDLPGRLWPGGAALRARDADLPDADGRNDRGDLRAHESCEAPGLRRRAGEKGT